MDLHGAIANSDMTTKYILPEIVTYIVNNLPPYLWGSYKRVDGWLKACREGTQDKIVKGL